MTRPRQWLLHGSLLIVLLISSSFIVWKVWFTKAERPHGVEPAATMQVDSQQTSDQGTPEATESQGSSISFAAIAGRELPLCGLLDVIPLLNEAGQGIEGAFLPFCEDIRFDIEGSNANFYRLLSEKGDLVSIKRINQVHDSEEAIEDSPVQWIRKADVQTPTMLKLAGKLYPLELMANIHLERVSGKWVIQGTNALCTGSEDDTLIPDFDIAGAEIVSAFEFINPGECST